MTQSHCATYSKELWPAMQRMVKANVRSDHVYDPMAGIGTVADIFPDLRPFGCELEPEYAAEADWIRSGNCLDDRDTFGFVCTSPPYGNRMADQYLGTAAERALRAETGKKPRRNGYAMDLNRRLTDGSAAALQWGPKYRLAMTEIWEHLSRFNVDVTGHLLVNVASHFRGGVYAEVSEWTLKTILRQEGMVLIDYDFVPTPGNRDGANRELRVGGEHLFLFEKEF